MLNRDQSPMIMWTVRSFSTAGLRQINATTKAVYYRKQVAQYEVDAMLEIAPEKVGHIIVKAREYDSKVAAWDDSSRSGDAEDDPSSILEAFTNDPTRIELVAFIDRLNVDEQVHLVALAWIGRGTFSAEEFDEAVQTARDERINLTSRYLLGMPLLPDYLEEGLEQLGISCEDAESEVL